jgi:hypothetical protein
MNQPLANNPENPLENIQTCLIDRQHIATTLDGISDTFHAGLLADYAQKYQHSSREANLSFLAVQKYAQSHSCLNQDDDSLRSQAKRFANSAFRLINQSTIQAGVNFAAQKGIAEPKAQNEAALAARLTDPQWWTRQLMKQQDQQFEQTAIKFALVRQGKQPYVSTATLIKLQARQQRSLDIMEKLQAVSEDGETVDMLDIIKGSPANPAVRRAELMNRLHGFEQYANEHQHIAEFYTLTAPSQYHPSSSKYADHTPQQTQQDYFSPLWARIRAKLKYQALTVYGFRIAEPHADACPHWHLLLFMPATQRAKVKAIFKDYALRQDGDETGAAQHRFTVESIDPKKGSAIGYIAKYIRKNVDGFAMEDEYDDETGEAIQAAAKRVRVWASVWRIRQFQQIGGSSITVWRELRRLKSELPDSTVEAARKAADSGNWKDYLEAQGGVDIPFRKQAIQTARSVKYDMETGELLENQYGEVLDYIHGVISTGYAVKTRLKHWIIEEKPEAEGLVDQTDQRAESAFDLPWSSVNNCRIPAISVSKKLSIN